MILVKGTLTQVYVSSFIIKRSYPRPQGSIHKAISNLHAFAMIFRSLLSALPLSLGLTPRGRGPLVEFD
jgi:hypothetical protein